MDWLRLDFETRSEKILGGPKSDGIYNYAMHASTKALLLAFKFPRQDVELHEFHLGAMPNRLFKALKDPDQILTAFNSNFERYILQFNLGITVPASRFQDPQASARYLSLPADLETVGEVLNLGPAFKKDKRGEELIKLFSIPQKIKPNKKKGIVASQYFNDWNSHPVEWREFGEYCKQDVIAEEEIARRLNLLGAFPLPERERNIWIFDQKVNDRGIPIDRYFILSARDGAVQSKKEALTAQNELTGLGNANSRAQLLPWAKQRGYPFSTLRKETVQKVLDDVEVNLTDLCRTVLTKRLEASSTTYTKLDTMLRVAGEDDRLHNQLIYMGSARCGRWSSGAVQLHNMARPTSEFENLDNLDAARQMIYERKFDDIKERFKSVLLTVKSCIRTVFVAPPGQRFNVCDLNAIETRVGAWVAVCGPLMDVFVKGRDPYLDFASKIYGIPYDNLWADYKGKNGKERQIEAKRMRQIAKPGVLGAIYRLGPGGWKRDPKGYKDHDENCDAAEVGAKYCQCETVHDMIKGGLWGYAENMGVKMTLEQAEAVVRIFRDSYEEIPECWYELERCVADVLREGTVNVVRTIGPEGCIQFDKIIIKGQGNLLRIKLPSGRYLHYLNARIEMTEMPWNKLDGSPVFKPTLVYAGIDQDTKQWDDYITSNGGKIFENIVQGIARDVLADKLLEIENIGIAICAHVHDEGIGLTPNDPMHPGVSEMERIMSQPVSWAATLPLKADGFESTYYHK